MSKYGNCKVMGYDSKKEASRAATLRLMKRAGMIADLREQVPFVLIPAQYGDDGKCIERECKYIADFVYTDTKTGREIVEDVKSPATRTKEYRIKKKLMLWVHGIRISEA